MGKMGQDYLELMKLAAEERRQEETSPPVDCPNDGTPLQRNSKGVLHCEFDGWTWRPGIH